MTQQTSGIPASADYRNDPSTRDEAREQATEVGRTAGAAGQRVAGTAAEQAGQVGQEARRQARDLLGQARGQVTEQARNGQQQASDGLRSLSRELHEMADGGQHQGPASDLAKQAADKLGDLAEWLGAREPGDLVQEVRALARRRPGAFLLGAAAAGVLAGRLTRGAVDANRDTTGHDVSRRATGPSSGMVTPAAPTAPPSYAPGPPTGEAAWPSSEPGTPPPYVPATPSTSSYPATDLNEPVPFDPPPRTPQPYPPADDVLPGDDRLPTPPSGSRTVGEYVDDLQSRGGDRPEAGGPR